VTFRKNYLIIAQTVYTIFDQFGEAKHMETALERKCIYLKSKQAHRISTVQRRRQKGASTLYLTDKENCVTRVSYQHNKCRIKCLRTG